MAQFEIKLSGELSTNCLSAGEDVPEYGILVDPLVRTPYSHHHAFTTSLLIHSRTERSSSPGSCQSYVVVIKRLRSVSDMVPASLAVRRLDR